MSAGDQVTKTSVEGNELSRLDAVEREVAYLRSLVMSLGRLDEATENIGTVTQGEWRFKDENDKLRMILSAINIIEEFGISAYLALFNTNRKPTWWADADNGDFAAAAGNTKINAHGILSRAWGIMLGIDAGDALLFGGMGLSGYGLRAGTHYLSPYTTDLFEDNGDFEYGDFTNYDLVGSPTIIEDSVDGTYCVEVDTDNYATRTFSATNGSYYSITLFAKQGESWGYPRLEFTGADITDYNLNVNPDWTKCVVVFKATDTSVTVAFRGSLVDSGLFYFDNIKLQKLQAFATISTDGLGNSGAILIKTWSDGLGGTTELKLDAPAIELSKVNLPAGETYNINGSPHTHNYLSEAPSDGKVYGRKDGVWAEASGGTISPSKMYPAVTDLLTSDAAGSPFAVVLISTGTATLITGEVNHPGILRISNNSTANAGARIQLPNNSLALQGGEIAEFVFRPLSNVAAVVSALGFLDQYTTAIPTDGVWISLAGNGSNITATPHTSNGGSITDGADLSTTMTASTWYRAKIVVNNDASQVDFYLYSEDGTELGHTAIATNIPTGATGFCIKAYRTNTTNTNLMDVDYMAHSNAKELVR